MQTKFGILIALAMVALIYTNADTIGTNSRTFIRAFPSVEKMVLDSTLPQEIWPMLGMRFDDPISDAYFPRSVIFGIRDLNTELFKTLSLSEGLCCVLATVENSRIALIYLDPSLYAGSVSPGQIVEVSHSAVLAKFRQLGTAVHEYFHFHEDSSGTLSVNHSGTKAQQDLYSYNEIRTHQVSNYFKLSAAAYANKHVPAQAASQLVSAQGGISRTIQATSLNEIEITRISTLLRPTLTPGEISLASTSISTNGTLQWSIPSSRTGALSGLSLTLNSVIDKAGLPVGDVLITLVDPSNPTAPSFTFRMPKDAIRLSYSTETGVFDLSKLGTEQRFDLLAQVYGFIVKRVDYARNVEIPNFKVVAANQETYLENLKKQDDRSTKTRTLTSESSPPVLTAGPSNSNLLPSAPGLAPRGVDPALFAQSVPLAAPHAIHNYARLYDPTLNGRAVGTFYIYQPGWSINVGGAGGGTTIQGPSFVPFTGFR